MKLPGIHDVDVSALYRCLQEDDPRHPLHGQRPAKHRLTSRNSFLDSTEALNTSKQDARTTMWVEEWNAIGERSTEWRDRGIIPNEHLASGTNEPWSTWRSLNRLRVQKGRCRAMMKMWKLSHTDVCDCGERQTMSHLMTCGDAPNCTWTDLAFPTLAGVNCAKHWEESIWQWISRTRRRRYLYYYRRRVCVHNLTNFCPYDLISTPNVP